MNEMSYLFAEERKNQLKEPRDLPGGFVDLFEIRREGVIREVEETEPHRARGYLFILTISCICIRALSCHTSMLLLLPGKRYGHYLAMDDVEVILYSHG